MANMNFDALIGARAAAVGLDDLAELFPDGPPEPPESEIERFWAGSTIRRHRLPTTPAASSAW